MKKKRPIALDLFCGVGGLGLGVEQAGFDVVAAFDALEFNVETHKKNFPHTKSFVADLSKLNGAELLELSKLRLGQLDLVTGGPPCQGFSVGGKRDLDDERNLLVYRFATLVKQLSPKYFLMENVQGLMTGHSRPVLDSFVRRVKHAGYRIVDPIKVLDAADFGVPQRRKRVIVLGYRKDLAPPNYPETLTPEHGFGRRRRMTVKDALSDLPIVDGEDEFLVEDTFRGSLRIPNRKYARLLRGLDREDSDLSVSRHCFTEGLTGFLRTQHSKAVVKRFQKTAPGSAEPISRYIRLNWDSVSPTLRAGTGTDHGSHTAPRPIHPEFPRCITTREAARLHSFPDWFLFHGTRWHDFRQIGNSVPPRLGRAIAQEIFKVLQ